MTPAPRFRFRAQALVSIAAGALCALTLAVLASRELGAAVPAVALERALEVQRSLALERPADAAVQEDLGNLLALAGDLAGAEVAYRAAIALDPAKSTAHMNLGTLLERTGEERQALKEYKRAIELDPENAWAHYESGSIYERWGLDALAKRSYARALGLDPKLADPAVNPHILENRHATSAMILSYRKFKPQIEAPKSYNDRARIAALLIERPSSADRLAREEGEPSPGEDPTGGYARMEGGTYDRGAAEDTGSEDVEEASRVLTTRDLDPSKETGQIVGGAIAGSPTRGKSSVEALAERTKAREAARASSRNTETVRGVSGGTNLPLNPGMAPRPGNNNQGGSSGGGTFIPSPESTGRISVELTEIPG